MSTYGASSVVDFAGIGSSDSSSFAESRWDSADLIFSEPLAFLILVDDYFFFSFFFELYGHNFISQQPFFGSLQVSFVGLFAIFILSLSGYFKVVCSFLGTETHADLVESVSETIMSNHIMQFLVAIPETFPGLSSKQSTLWRMKGALDMDSNPPVTATSAWSRAIDCAPKQTDLSPEEHTLLMVVQGTSSPRPARTAACRAGACPTPAPKTFPRTTSSTSLGLRLMDSRAPLVAN